MNQSADDLLTRTAGQLIVSCQAYPGEPMITHPTSLTRWFVEAMH